MALLTAPLTAPHTPSSTVPSTTRPRPHTPGEPLAALSDYRHFGRRHVKVLLGCMGIGLLLGVVWTLRQPTTYSATASVVLAPVPSYVSVSPTRRPPPDVTIDSDAQLIRAPEVLTAVAGAARTAPETLPQRLTVTATPLSRVLHVRFTDDSPVRAARGATAAAAALVEVRKQTLGALRADQSHLLGLRISELQDRLNGRQSRFGVIPPDDPLVTQIATLRARFDDLENVRASPAAISRRAVPPSRADGKNTEVPPTSGLMLGLLAGCAVGAALDRAETRRARARRTPPPVRFPARSANERVEQP